MFKKLSQCKEHGKMDDCASKTMPVKVKKSANPHDAFLAEDVSKAKEKNWSRGRAVAATTTGGLYGAHGLVAGKGTGGKLKSAGSELGGSILGSGLGSMAGAIASRGNAAGRAVGAVGGALTGAHEGGKFAARSGWMKPVKKGSKNARNV